MFGLGWSEFVLLFGLILVVLGPDRMPGLVRTIGRLAGRARSMARQFTERLDREAAELQSAADMNDLRARAKDGQPSAAPDRQNAQGQGEANVERHRGSSVPANESHTNVTATNAKETSHDRP